MQLTTDQRNAINDMIAFIFSNDTFFVLKGYAGTGKTTCLATLIEEIGEMADKFYATATTHKAAKVLRDKLPIPTSTIHSLLRLKLTDDTEQQHLVFANDAERDNAMNGAVVIVDEASMMTVELLKHAEKWCRDNDAKMIFVGDPAQLPPVEKDKSLEGLVSPVWQLNCCSAELNEIMRYDGGIAVLGERIRQAIDSEDQFFTVHSDNDGQKGVFKTTTQGLEDAIRRAAQKHMFLEDIEIVATAYTNARVAELNDIVRASMWGDGANQQFVKDERIVLTAPYKTVTPEGVKINLRNREEFRVLHTEEYMHKHTVDYGESNETVQYKAWKLICENELGLSVILYTIDVDELAHFNEVSEAIAYRAKNAKSTWEGKRLWSQFWKHKGTLAAVSYAYCFTTHTTQGSTFNNVLVDVQNIMGLYKVDIRTRLRSLYVACTRAAKVLVVN